MIVSTPFSLKKKIMGLNKTSKIDFYEYMEKMKGDFNNTIKENEFYYKMNAKALMGEQEGVAYFFNEIEKYLRNNPFKGSLPPAYSSPIEGLFHEWKGFGPAYKWFLDRQYGDSSGLSIIGKNIYVNQRGRFIPYPYSMPSLDRVDQLKRALLKADERKRVDMDHPAEEFKMNDPLWPGRFIRIAMWVYPRTWEEFPTISMRRQVIEYLDLDDQAGTKSIPFEAVNMLRQLFQTNRNTIVAGSVGSGKTTFANTVVGEQLTGANECKGVIMIEKHPESILPYVFSDRHRIIPVMAKNEDLMDVGVESLRHDPNYIYMTEMRYKEWQFYNWAGSKGYQGLIGTFHTVDSEDIPYQGAIAVYTEQGGSLKGHLISALQASELVIIMESHEGKKRIQRISEVRFDEDEQSVFAHDIMRWDEESKSWSYNPGLSERLIQRMERSNPIATRKFLDELIRLSEKSFIRNPLVESKRSRAVLSGN